VSRVASIGQALAACLLTAACATTPPAEKIAPGQTPASNSLEAGLWMRVERSEQRLATSGRLVRDPALNEYVRGIVCRLAADYCADIRVYVVRAAGFNASMAPNGYMSVWTGLLLRAENEAQVAFVLGHELEHYLKRHSLNQWRDLRAKTDALVFFQIATAVAGVAPLGYVAQIAVLGSYFSFSREQERAADGGGLKRMVAAGYDPRAAPSIWNRLIEEKDASDDYERPLIFFSTHPASEEREKTLAARAAEIDSAGKTLGESEFQAVTASYRNDWLRDEIRQRDFGRLEVVLDHLAANGTDPALVFYYRGELYRLRGAEDDADKAIEAYTAAIDTGGAPPEAHRALGLVYWAEDRPAAARAALERYLASRPGAEDRTMIEYYLERIP